MVTDDGAGHWTGETPWYEQSWTVTESGETQVNVWYDQTGPSAYVPVPFWQLPLGNPLPGNPPPSVTGRLVPDLTFDAFKNVPDNPNSYLPLPATMGARVRRQRDA